MSEKINLFIKRANQPITVDAPFYYSTGMAVTCVTSENGVLKQAHHFISGDYVSSIIGNDVDSIPEEHVVITKEEYQTFLNRITFALVTHLEKLEEVK